MVRAIGVALAACMSLAGAPTVAAEAPAVVAWSTYLRSGPSAASRVIDEVEHDTAVVRLGCASGWCRVRAGRREGYVDQAALDLPAPRATGGGDCVSVRLADDTAGPFTRLCGAGPAIARPGR